jgi:hypothetical protein
MILSPKYLSLYFPCLPLTSRRSSLRTSSAPQPNTPHRKDSRLRLVPRTVSAHKIG